MHMQMSSAAMRVHPSIYETNPFLLLVPEKFYLMIPQLDRELSINRILNKQL